MKKWETPEVSNLGLEKTKDGGENCSCSVTEAIADGVEAALYNNKHHYCHGGGNGGHNHSGPDNGNENGKGHFPSQGCTNPAHYKNGKCTCCCYNHNDSGTPDVFQS